MKLSLEVLNQINLKTLEKYALGRGDVEFLSAAGHSHYPLLAYISESFNNCKFLDIGTHYGWSALSLAKNLTNNVVTYDLKDCILELNSIDKKSIKDISNIIFKQKNFLDDLNELENTKLIFLDVDPHDGLQEKIIFDALKENNFNGVLICDDIHLNPGMRTFWNNIDLPKEDLTRFGHYSGTGFVYFNRKSQ